MAKKKSKSKTSKHPATPIIPPIKDQVENVIASALSKAPPVLMKVCRLCEMKDGPFLNIFDADKITAKKIEELMPFGIAENDDLPHKICFRCSAKVEELHEFIQKCIKTQENLRSVLGKQGPLTMKSRTRVRWEQQLHKTKLSNDDICDVLIKRAMEGIPLNAPLDDIVEEKPSSITRNAKVEPAVIAKESSSSETSSEDDDDADISLKQVKLSIAKTDEEATITRSSRSTRSTDLNEGLETYFQTLSKVNTYTRKPQTNVSTDAKSLELQKPKISNPVEVENKKEPVAIKPKEIPPPPEPKPTAAPFNIMDHVSTIKVNGVGTLFQCKLCIRNFLKKEIVMNHGCAKNNAPPKETSTANSSLPEVPKPPTVKYIQMNNNLKKSLNSLVDKPVEKIIEPIEPPPKPIEPEIKPKLKPKVGPASRVKPKSDLMKETQPKESLLKPTSEVPNFPSAVPPSVSFPIAPSLNSRYKLVPGPNNTFQLVEESAIPEEKFAEDKPVEDKPALERKTSKHRTYESSSKMKQLKTDITKKSSSAEVIDLDENNESRKAEPYPVGLFQPVPHHSSVYPSPNSPMPFTTPAMKKQSYTIVQTGNPSKLLISTKPQPVSEEPPKKKLKKKTEVKNKEPYKVTVEDVTPPKDPGFFTFVSLDPLLQPSYVLPTDNIIQESQITTSTPGAKPALETRDKDKYPCNMCGETFSREKKLLAHIQSHYNQMDEEDEKRSGKPGPKRRTRKC